MLRLNPVSQRRTARLVPNEAPGGHLNASQQENKDADDPLLLAVDDAPRPPSLPP